MKRISKLWWGLGALILLVPLGLILPEYFKAKSAWGEWDQTEIKRLVGYLPQGLEKLSNLWSAPLPDYAFKNWQVNGLGYEIVAYVFSAVVGVAFCVGVSLILGKFLSKKQ